MISDTDLTLIKTAAYKKRLSVSAIFPNGKICLYEGYNLSGIFLGAFLTTGSILSMISTQSEEEESPSTDDDDYECYSCGEPTGRGYDSGQCCQCLGED